MASNHTQHYELSQWQATDEVVRTDFNEDNAKIDAALHGKLGRREIIKTLEAEGTGRLNDLNVPVDDVDWNEWECVGIFLDLSRDAQTPLSFRLNDTSSLEIAAASACQPACVLLFPWHDGTRKAWGVTLCEAVTPFFSRNDLFSSLQNIVVRGTIRSVPKTQVVVFGMR